MSLERPDTPNVFLPAPPPNQTKHTSEISKVAWNTQVAHIVASASNNGSVIVWDLRQKKPWCELREQNRSPVSDICWNPTEGLHMVTASSDDSNPVIKLWDLRASTTMPLAVLKGEMGHNQGVLGVDWCPHDPRLLMSTGKDNKTLMWDLYSLKAIAELPSGGEDKGQQGGGNNPNSIGGAAFGGMGASQQKRFAIQWSPHCRGVISTCSFDRKIQAHSVVGAGQASGKAPKWLQRPAGVTTGFGGKIVKFNATLKTGVEIGRMVEEPVLKAASEYFEGMMANRDYKGFCGTKIASAQTEKERQVWGFMSLIFEANAREQLVQYLGFDAEAINKIAMEFEPDSASMGASNGNQMGPQAKETVKKALLVGNFEAAVECCFKNGQLADALVLSSCGGAELWSKTQAMYFERESAARPYLKIVNAVINSNLGELVESSDLGKWRETLAILSTYGKSEEFSGLCEQLGGRLQEAGDVDSAALCYMSALNISKTVAFWKEELDRANRGGETDVMALHAFIEKVTVFSQTETKYEFPPGVQAMFTQYAESLANQGLGNIGMKYATSQSQECAELRDRLWNGADDKRAAGRQPGFPWGKLNVGISPEAGGVARPKPQVQQQQQGGGGQQRGGGGYLQQRVGGQGYGQQQQQVQQQQQQVQQQPQQTPANPGLPPGWLAMQDPGSGRTYYANQQTGQTTWDPPPMPMPAAPIPEPQVIQPPVQATTPNKSFTGGAANLANKYGDGFVSSASNPELAAQYGNIGTANPYNGAARPAGANVAGSSTGTPHHVQAAPAPEPEPVRQEIPPEMMGVVNGLKGLIEQLGACQLGTTEKKQLGEISKGAEVLFVRLATPNAVDGDTAGKVQALVAALQGRDYGTAGNLSTALANTVWKQHKEWLKGIKFLIQICGKKL